MEVNSFWADELTALERLCMSSFVQSGITYNLYVYDEPAGVPAGVAVRDASEILPRDQVFRYNAGNFNRGSVSGFSNLFRYSVIHQRGGWWIDTDICFLRDFDQPAALVGFPCPFIEEASLLAFELHDAGVAVRADLARAAPVGPAATNRAGRGVVGEGRVGG